MKRTLPDRIIGYFSPNRELRRAVARAKLDVFRRTYDAAQTFNTDDWTSATKGGANKEAKPAQPVLRDKARDAYRNNPYAKRAVEVAVTETVGHGIVPNIKGKDPKHTDTLRAAWKLWAESTMCDAEGLLNYYGLQAAVMSGAFGDGEVLARKYLVKEPTVVTTVDGPKNISVVTRIQLLESDFLDSTKDDKKTVQGVEVDQYGKAISYWLYNVHPGEGQSAVSSRIARTELLHIFQASRRGQKRGISQFHAVLRSLEDLKSYEEATLIRQKIAACFTVFITPGENDTNLTQEQRTAQRQQDSAVEPGLIRYGNSGETINIASPPGMDGHDSVVRYYLRRIAVGVGLTYELVSGDYSQSNFSSSRLSNQPLNKNIDNWRWNLIIPQFCEPTFKWFLEWANLALGIDVTGVTATWTPPAREFIDPSVEVESIKKAIRTGIKTLPEAIRERGYDPETFLKEFAESNAMLDKLGLALDSDPRKLSNVGFGQAGETYDKLMGTETQGDKSSENSKKVPTEGTP